LVAEMERVAELMARFFVKAMLMVAVGILYIFGFTDYQNVSEIVKDIERYDPSSQNEIPFI
jgi:hypothetical protein